MKDLLLKETKVNKKHYVNFKNEKYEYFVLWGLTPSFAGKLCFWSLFGDLEIICAIFKWSRISNHTISLTKQLQYCYTIDISECNSLIISKWHQTTQNRRTFNLPVSPDGVLCWLNCNCALSRLQMAKGFAILCFSIMFPKSLLCVKKMEKDF